MFLWDGLLECAISYLLEARDNVPSDGADQSSDVVHEAFRETILPWRLQSLGKVQVVDDALHLR